LDFGRVKRRERPAVNLSMQIIHLEKGKMGFALEKLPVAEEFSLNSQFTDGAEYRIDAMAEARRPRNTFSKDCICEWN
jgi:hypothetical protein